MLRTFLIYSLLLLLSLASAGVALAAPKTVAIVNLSDSPEALAAARQVREILNALPELRPTNPGDLARALESALPQNGLDGLVVQKSSDIIAASEKALEEFNYAKARKGLQRARILLFGIKPKTKVIQLLAKLSFQMALVHMRQQNMGLAMEEWGLFHQLIKQESIDPVKYPPEVVKAFKQSRTLAAQHQKNRHKKAQLSISSTFDGAPVYINGRAVGPSPLKIALHQGTHLVSIATPQYRAKTVLVRLDAGAAQSLTINLEARSPTEQAAALRFKAKLQGFTSQSVREAASEVSRLVGSDSVLVIVDQQGPLVKQGVTAQLYIAELGRLSYAHLVNSELKNFFGIVAEGKRPTLLDKQPRLGPLPWYRKPWAIAAVGAGTALAIVSILTFNAEEDGPSSRKAIFIWK